MSRIERLTVVGGSLAGLRAVEAARKAGFGGEITLIGGERHLPYDRPPLSKEFLEPGSVLDPVFRSESTLVHDLGVRLMLGSPATGLDTDARLVQVGEREVPYDALVIATGANPRTLAEGDGLAGVHGLRTLDDSLAIRDALDRRVPTVVVGAGFIGSELASSAKQRGVDVTVVEALPAPLERAVGSRMGPAIASLHHHNGTVLRCGSGVRAIEGDGQVERVVLDDGTELPAGLVVVGIGVAPAVEWLAGSGLTLDDGVACDESLWTGLPGVYAAGDVANWPNPVFGERQRMQNWTAAAEQGAAAVRNALDPANAKPYATVPYFWSDWYGVRVQHVGSADADEVEVVEGDLGRMPSRDNRWVALYRSGKHLVGALTVEGQAEIMKYRMHIMRGGSWGDALTHAAERASRHAAKSSMVPIA